MESRLHHLNNLSVARQAKHQRLPWLQIGLSTHNETVTQHETHETNNSLTHRFSKSVLLSHGHNITVNFSESHKRNGFLTFFVPFHWKLRTNRLNE